MLQKYQGTCYKQMWIYPNRFRKIGIFILIFMNLELAFQYSFDSLSDMKTRIHDKVNSPVYKKNIELIKMELQRQEKFKLTRKKLPPITNSSQRNQTITSERNISSQRDPYTKSMFQIMKPGKIKLSKSQPKKVETVADFKEILKSIPDKSSPPQKIIEQKYDQPLQEGTERKDTAQKKTVTTHVDSFLTYLQKGNFFRKIGTKLNTEDKTPRHHVFTHRSRIKTEISHESVGQNSVSPGLINHDFSISVLSNKGQQYQETQKIPKGAREKSVSLQQGLPQSKSLIEAVFKFQNLRNRLKKPNQQKPYITES